MNSLTHTLALTNQDRQGKRNQRRAHGPFIALNRSARQTYVKLGRLHLGQSFIVDLLHRAWPIFQMQIEPAG